MEEERAQYIERVVSDAYDFMFCFYEVGVWAFQFIQQFGPSGACLASAICYGFGDDVRYNGAVLLTKLFVGLFEYFDGYVDFRWTFGASWSE